MQKQDSETHAGAGKAEPAFDLKDRLLTLAVILAFLVFGAAVMKTLSSSGEGRQAVLEGPPAGTPVSLAGVEWARGDRTLLLVLSKGCHYCTESARFYRRLAREAERSGKVQVVAVLPQDVATGRGYLDGLGVDLSRVGTVQSAPFDALGVPGTPTLILVDRAGTVVASWVGQLPAEREEEVVDRLLGRRSA